MIDTAISIDKDRLNYYFSELAKIGATPLGGVTRLALTDEDKAGRELFIKWLTDLGCTVRYDDVGNIYGHYAGTDDSLPPVLLGSHLDSVYQGGQFDGALGVMCGLEVIAALKASNTRLRHPIELASFTNEEGVRFQPAVLASGVIAGEFTPEFAYSRTDLSGKTFGEELERIGYKGSATNRPTNLKAYLELHIEQGPVLEDLQLEIGVVEGIQGVTWLEVTFDGQSNHSGTTPMNRRQDALVAASRVIIGLQDLAFSVPDTVATVGRIQVEPNIVNAVPGKVTLWIDIRNPANAQVQKVKDLAIAMIEEISQSQGVESEVNQRWLAETTYFDTAAVSAVESSTKSLGFSYQRMMSGAGHDAMYMARLCPTAMIFVPTIDGKSHCQEESAHWDLVEKAANVLLNSVLKLAS